MRYRTIGLNGPYYGSSLFKGVHIRFDGREGEYRVTVVSVMVANRWLRALLLFIIRVKRPLGTIARTVSNFGYFTKILRVMIHIFVLQHRIYINNVYRNYTSFNENLSMRLRFCLELHSSVFFSLLLILFCLHIEQCCFRLLNELLRS